MKENHFVLNFVCVCPNLIDRMKKKKHQQLNIQGNKSEQSQTSIYNSGCTCRRFIRSCPTKKNIVQSVSCVQSPIDFAVINEVDNFVFEVTRTIGAFLI